MSSIACRGQDPSAPSPKLDDLAKAPTALLADAHRAVVGLGEPLRNHGGKATFVGEALTIHAGSLAQWKALDDGGTGPDVMLPKRILEAVRAVPVVERAETP